MNILKSLVVLAILLFAALVQAAGLKVSEPVIDFGTIKEGPPVIKKSTLTNSGTQKLTIANVTTS
ncbi:MAG: DUF1573 domain-containing protein [Deltaproteobacteria bacterium]|nr:DUF1573 domain-containing protein [Deltaproteobacteria bacterium]